MPDEAPTTDAPPAGDAPTDDNTPLGPAGQKALDAMKERVKAAEAEAREAKALRKQVADLTAAHETEQEAAVRKAGEEAASKVRGELGSDLTNARLELAILKSDAGKKLADPADFLALGDVKSVTAEDGSIDAKKLEKAVDDLLRQKPHLSAQRVPVTPGGPRGTTAEPDMNSLIRDRMRR